MELQKQEQGSKRGRSINVAGGAEPRQEQTRCSNQSNQNCFGSQQNPLKQHIAKDQERWNKASQQKEHIREGEDVAGGEWISP